MRRLNQSKFSTRHSLRISDKHGVNPFIPICFYCGHETNMVALGGLMHATEDNGEVVHDVSMEREKVVINMTPCDSCAEWMKRGIIIISVKDSPGGQREKNEQPVRTGGWWVVKAESEMWQAFNDESRAKIMESRSCFLEDSLCAKLGLVKGEPNAQGG